MKLLYIINSSHFFVSHFLHIAKNAKSAGYEVHVAAGDVDCSDIIKCNGCIFHSIKLNRSGYNIFEELESLYLIRKLIKTVKPEIVHSFTIKPNIYVGIVKHLLRINRKIGFVFSVTGMGSLYLSRSLYKRLAWKLVKFFYRLAFSNDSVLVVFENTDDRDYFNSSNLVSMHKSRIINGAGVDVGKFIPGQRELPFKVLCVARLLKDKGIEEFIEAGKILKNKNINVNLVLVGDIDPNNPSSLNKHEIDVAVSSGFVEYYGYRTDIEHIYSTAAIACLPSYREGLPKSLIEAASCGLPIVTTNVPGCRQMINSGLNGILVDVRSSISLASAIESLATDVAMLNIMGSESRRFAVENFSNEAIEYEFMKFYQHVS
jgi:glycosyltransferase involved in cell wall biosynthesis